MLEVIQSQRSERNGILRINNGAYSAMLHEFGFEGCVEEYFRVLKISDIASVVALTM